MVMTEDEGNTWAWEYLEREKHPGWKTIAQALGGCEPACCIVLQDRQVGQWGCEALKGARRGTEDDVRDGGGRRVV